MSSKRFFNYQRKQLSPDLTPLIDVVFLLLIFFMVASTFDQKTGLKIELPKSTLAKATNKEIEKITVLMDREEKIKIRLEKDNRVTEIESSLESLQKDLKEKITGFNNKKVAIMADKEIDYGKVVEIMSEVKLSGATAIDIEMKKESKK